MIFLRGLCLRGGFSYRGLIIEVDGFSKDTSPPEVPSWVVNVNHLAVYVDRLQRQEPPVRRPRRAHALFRGKFPPPFKTGRWKP